MTDPSAPSFQVSGPILLFDGVCNLCNGTVQFIIRADRHRIFRFASLQSEAGARLLEEANYQGPPLNSVVCIKDHVLYTQSDAVLEVAKSLGGLWSLAYIFKLVPKKLRDSAYNWVAQNRYRWFGRKEQCMIPSPDVKNRFL